MGTFRTVVADGRCPACGGSSPFVVQFETGRDSQEDYVEGGVASDLAPGAVYEAITDVLCEACRRRWEWTLAEATVAAAVSLVSEGASTLHDLARPERPGLSAEVLRARLERLRVAVLGGHLPRALIGFLDVLDELQAEAQPSDRFDDAVRARMRTSGWVNGPDAFREDIEVWIDPRRRVRVRRLEPPASGSAS